MLTVVAALCIAGIGCKPTSRAATCDPPDNPFLYVYLRDAVTGVFLGLAGGEASAALDGQPFMPLRPMRMAMGEKDTLFIAAGAEGSPAIKVHLPGHVPDTLFIGGGSEGSYTVRVRRPGYLPWDTTGVLIRGPRSGCGGRSPMDVIAKLQPAR